MFTTANEAINFIESRKRFTPKKDLSNMEKLLNLYSNPHLKNQYIHVAGTNGKGSTVSYIANTLIKAHYNVGIYVSPYVTCFNERIQINNNYISDEDIVCISNYIISKEKLYYENKIQFPSFFEFVTLMAFIYFSLNNLDIVVMETGMGGTLDSTNVINPIVSVITNVNYDHMAILGNTLEEIANNKLGIVKDGVPLFTIQNDRLLPFYQKKCWECHSELYYIKLSDINNINITIDSTTFDFLDNKRVKVSLLGKYQTENAAIAISVLKYLNDNHYFNISKNDIYNGLETVFWPGRLEKVLNDPLVFLDGAHNIDGISRLVEYIHIIKHDPKYSEKYIKLFFAVSADKEKDKMISLIDHLPDEIVFTKFQYRRSDDQNYLYMLSNHRNKRVLNSTIDVFNEIKKDYGKIIICCGSLYFISELRKLFKENI